MVPLICELDKGLLHTDLATELLVNKFKTSVQQLLVSSFDFKRLRAIPGTEHPDTDQLLLPFNHQVREFLTTRHGSGQKIILITEGSKHTAALKLQGFNSFDEIVSRKEVPSLLDKLKSFEFIGNANSEDALWIKSEKRYVIEKAGKASRKLSTLGLEASQVFSAASGASLKTVSRTLRVHQWLKNILVFVPLVTAQKLTNPELLFSALLMFVCFSLVASAGYIINDLLDLQSDRLHPEKKNRPFASGNLSAKQGVIIGLFILGLATICAAYLPISAVYTLVAYFILTFTYSIYLKTKLMMDVVVLGTLFTLRVLGGAQAIGTELSFYLLSFSIFLFASLGMVKRYAELHNLKKRDQLSARGRGYQVEDMAPVRIIGISMGYMSVFILGQYINSPLVTQYYSSPKLIWLLFPLLMFWLGRLWILANRGEVNEDPLVFTVKDRTSQLVFLTSAAVLFAAN